MAMKERESVRTKSGSLVHASPCSIPTISLMMKATESEPNPRRQKQRPP